MSSSSVTWNGSPVATTYSTSNQLQAQITAADIANSGTAAVSVFNPSPGGGNSGATEFTINAAFNPAPTLGSLNPSSVNAGNGGFILTLNGTNFIPASTIEWNGQALSTSYLSGTQLEAQIPASDLADPGSADVAVLNPTPGGGTSALVVFTIAYAPTVVSQSATDIVWDAAHQLIYLSAPSLASSNGNTIVALNPTSGAIQSSQFAGSEPDVLAISGDDQFLYAALDGSSSVSRFILPNLQPDIDYSLGADPNYGPYFAVDLQVAPGLPHTTAVSRGNFVVSPVALGGMAIYDDAVQRPAIAYSPGPSYDSLQWGSDSTIYAINSEISTFDLYAMTVNSNGVTLSEDYQNEFSSFGVRMHYDSGTGFVYTDDGYVINPTNGQHVGAFPAAGYMVPDSTLNAAFFLGQTQYQFGTTNFSIESFDLTTFVPTGEIVIPNVHGNPLRFIRWGTSGLTFNDDAGFVYIINSSFVGGNAQQRKGTYGKLYPVAKTWATPKVKPKERVRDETRLNRTQKDRKHSFSSQGSNPAPVITTLSPSTVVAGINDFTLTVTGSNFVSFSTIEWNGSQRQTEYVSSSELQAQINASDVATAGSASVNVVTPSPGGGSSNALSFTIISETVTPAPIIVSLYPNSVNTGSPGFTLMVNGYAYFNSSSVAEWNGSPRPTSLYGSGALQVQISASDVAIAGTAAVTVFTPAPGGGTSNTAEFQILYQPLTVNQITNDMAWDPLNQVFYISVPSSASTNSNQVCVVNPITAAVTNCQPGSEPDKLAISDDSQFLYVAMDGIGSVQRFILPGLTPDISYALGTAQGSGYPYYALDLQVAPGAPHTTAVSLGTETDPAATGGVTIYDDSTPRPTTAPGWGPSGDLYDSLQWGANATELYAASTEGNNDFYTLNVNSSGVALDQDYPEVFWNPSRINYYAATGLIYSDDGFHVIDPSTGLPVNIFEVGGGWPMAPDSTLNTVFILGQYIEQQNSIFTIDLFDMTTFTPVAKIPFSTSENSFNPAARFIRWGSNGLAVNFKGGEMYILSGSFVNGQPAHRSESQSKPIPKDRTTRIGDRR